MKEYIVKIWKEYTGMEAIIRTTISVVGCFVGCFGIMCLKALLVMLLWNWVAVDLFGAPTLTFWVAFGLRWLCSLLFRSKAAIDTKSKN